MTINSDSCLPKDQPIKLLTKPEDAVQNQTSEIDFLKARKFPQIVASFAASLGAFVFGTTLGWSSPVQPQLQSNINITTYHNSNATNSSIWNLQLTEQEMSWVGSLISIGSIIGSLSGGFLMSRFGGRLTMMSMSIPYVIGWIILTLAVDTSMLYAGRILCGIAAGICTAVIPSYIGEISTPNLRGTVGNLFTLSLVTGVLLASILAWLPWRLITGILIIPPLFFFVAMYFVPESPYFLMKINRIADAQRSLEWLRGSHYDISSEMTQLQSRIRDLQSEKSAFKLTDLRYPWAYKPILIGVVKMILQQFSGLSVVQLYTIAIFAASGSSLDPRISSVILNIIQVLAAAISSTVLVDRFGRRTLTIFSEFSAALCLFVLGAYLYISKHDPTLARTFNWLPVTCLIIYIAVINLGLSPLAWVVSHEVLPDKLKGPGSSLAAFTNLLSAFVTTKTFFDLIAAITDAGAFWFYGSCCLLGVLFNLFLMPETKGKTSEEIAALFR